VTETAWFDYPAELRKLRTEIDWLRAVLDDIASHGDTYSASHLAAIAEFALEQNRAADD
jgi:hypothetical protein